jgi:hypothetical protein
MLKAVCSFVLTRKYYIIFRIEWISLDIQFKLTLRFEVFTVANIILRASLM